MAEWKYTVEGWGKIFHADEPDTRVKRDQLVELLRASQWYAAQEDGEESELAQRINDLEHCDVVTEMDKPLWEIYNLADDQRAWLNPFA